MADLFDAATLTGLSGRPVSADTVAALNTWVQAIVEGEIGTIPDPVPPDVTAVALELAEFATPSPGGVRSTTIGPYSAMYADRGNARLTLSHEQRIRLRRAVGKSKVFDVVTDPPKPPADATVPTSGFSTL